jgi:hypothetical protein
VLLSSLFISFDGGNGTGGNRPSTRNEAMMIGYGGWSLWYVQVNVRPGSCDGAEGIHQGF